MSRDWCLISLGVDCWLAVLSIYPFRLTGEFRHDDTLAHFLAGLGISLILAGWSPGRNDSILGATAAAAVVWEIGEGAYFECEEYLSRGCLRTVARWLVREDTVLDMCKVVLGGFVGLRLTGRYD